METQYINLNMTPTGVNPCFHISQYDDGRMLGFIVHSGGATVDLDTYTCTIEATRSDGTAITSAVATTDNIGTFEVTPTMSNKADKYRCQLVIVDENSKRIASLPFDMEVTKAAMDENSEAIEEDASLYQQYTEAVQGAIAEANADIQAEASTRASADSNLQSQIDQIIAPSGEAPSAAEVQNARTGADGVTYPTLGVAIRTQVANVKTAIAENANSRNEMIGDFNWELGGISAVDGTNVTRTDGIRTALIPITPIDAVYYIRVDNAVASNWFVNAYYYTKDGSFLGTLTPGSSMNFLSGVVIPGNSYPSIAFIRFVIYALSGGVDVMSEYASVYNVYIRSGSDASFQKKLQDLSSDYDIVNLEFISGGIASGVVYESDRRCHTVTGYPFPVGSKIVVPDGITALGPFKLGAHLFYEGNRFCQDTDWINIADVNAYAFPMVTQRYNVAIAVAEIEDRVISADMIEELSRIIKIATPKNAKSHQDEAFEERLSGDITGAYNYFTEIPFAYGKQTSFGFEASGNVFTQLVEDSTNWSYNNCCKYIDLKPGTYHFYTHFISNSGTQASAIAYVVFALDGTRLVDLAFRDASHYDVERTFTLSEDTTIGIQVKSYVGNKFSVYVYGDPYDSLKMLSERVDTIETMGTDPIYTEIYADPVKTARIKLATKAEAGRVVYGFLTDNHLNVSYDDNNLAQRRQFRALVDTLNGTGADFIVLGGDTIDGNPLSGVYQITEEFFAYVKANNIPVAILSGNHDDNGYIAPQGKAWRRAYIIDRTTVPAVFPSEDVSYYYFDVPRKNTRIVCLDSADFPEGYNGTSWWSLSQAQVEWFIETIRSTNYDIAVMTHMSPEYARNSWGLGNEGGYQTDLINVITAFNSNTSITLYGSTYDFSNTQNKIRWMHCGHSHIEYMEDYKVAGIPCVNTGCGKQSNQTISSSEQRDPDGDEYTYILTEAVGSEFHANSYGYKYRHFTPRTIGTIKESLFDVVSANSNAVYTFRVGIGVDRTFTF